jgi:hypothetical protein
MKRAPLIPLVVAVLACAGCGGTSVEDAYVEQRLKPEERESLIDVRCDKIGVLRFTDEDVYKSDVYKCVPRFKNPELEGLGPSGPGGCYGFENGILITLGPQAEIEKPNGEPAICGLPGD